MTLSVSVERFNDPKYARPRYRLRHVERQSYLADGYTVRPPRFITVTPV